MDKEKTAVKEKYLCVGGEWDGQFVSFDGNPQKSFQYSWEPPLGDLEIDNSGRSRIEGHEEPVRTQHEWYNMHVLKHEGNVQIFYYEEDEDPWKLLLEEYPKRQRKHFMEDPKTYTPRGN